MPKEFRPYGGRIVVEKITEKERGGLLIPQMAQKRGLIGRVLHVGPDVEGVVPGQMILFAQYSGCSPYMDADLVKRYGDNLLVMNGEDILCFIDDVPAAEAAA